MEQDPHPLPHSVDAALFMFAPDGIVVADGEGRIVRVNPRAEQLFGYGPGELEGQRIELLVPKAARGRHEEDRRSFASRPSTRPMGDGLRLNGLRRDGSEFPVEIALVPIRSPEGAFVLAIVRDVTSRREAEDELGRYHEDLESRVRARTADLEVANRRLVQEQAKRIQTEKLSSIGLLASGVAHEINNPLSGVMGLVRAIRDGSAEDERETFFDAVEEGLERMRTTVQGLLNFSRQQPPAPEILDVADVCAACARLVGPAAAGKQVAVDLQVEHGASFVRADRSQLMQAVVNVLLNGIHAAPAGTVVGVGAVTEVARAGIRITDHGPGIPAEILDKVCDPFFTTKPEGVGTGLGLAVTLNIVRAHGGDLSIDSDASRGTTMTLWFPMKEEGAGA